MAHAAPELGLELVLQPGWQLNPGLLRPLGWRL
jgi:hypothetical protein